jgi:DNA-binding MarR family transcriptional regulator
MQRRPEQISPVESHLAYWLNYVAYRITHALRDRTLEFGVTAAESVLLRKLHEHEDGAMPSLLARRLGLSRSHISRLAMRLEIKGLLHREKSVSDRRALILTLTGYGRVLLPYLAAAAEETDASNFSGAGDAPLETIEKVMKWVVYCGRFRFVPQDRCRIVHEHQYMDPDWEVEMDEDGDRQEDS